MNDYYSHIDGYIQREDGGVFQGRLSIQQIDISPLDAIFFKDDDNNDYIWIKRKPIMEYNMESQSYTTRQRKPFFEAYLKKQVGNDGVVAYKGEFMFMRFRFLIIGVWDAVLGTNKQRLNLYVERLPMSQQTILNDINERRKKEKKIITSDDYDKE